MIKNNFTLVFRKNDVSHSCRYLLADSLIAQKWFTKIKHLKNIPLDPIESELKDFSNLEKIYADFCEKFGLEKLTFDNIRDQKNLNTLHKVYEVNHKKLSRMKDNELLYMFHHAVHHAESKTMVKNKIHIGWGVKEGPLTEVFPCHNYYSDSIIKNNLYLSWAELGKKPLEYYKNAEPSTQERVNELCKPHTTLRAKFFVALDEHKVEKFDNEFIKWFNPYKQNWLETHQLSEYTEKHHYSAPLLATADHDVDLSDAEFVKIVL